MKQKQMFVIKNMVPVTTVIDFADVEEEKRKTSFFLFF